MGYTTDFAGEVEIVPPLNQDEIDFLTDFSQSRRMHRSGGPLFVKGEGWTSRGNPDTVYEHNGPDPDQPGLWCQWVPTEDGTALTWDGVEKFYNSLEWMTYIVTNLLAPSARPYIDAHLEEDERLKSFTCNHVLNGTIDADGEDPDDIWQLIVTNNAVTAAEGKIVYSADDLEKVHQFHGWTFEITSVAVDVKGPLGYVLTKVSLEEAVAHVLTVGTPDGKAV